MKIRYFQIAGGNDTALVSGAKSRDIEKTTKKLLSEVEQVGFFIKKGPKYTLRMMGDELCINAVLAGGFLLGGEGRIYTAGKPVYYKICNNEVELKLALPYKRGESLVIFEDIGYKLIEGDQTINKRMMKNFCVRYKLPAFGVIRFSGGSINPFVYVKKTNTLVNETACGSGSIATSVLTGRKKIVQPTGKSIFISARKNKFTVRAEVEEIKK